MIRKIVKLISDPKKYIPLLFKVVQQHICFLFRNTAFFMQGQMDINGRSRWYNKDFINETGGFYPKGGDHGRAICDLEPWDNTRRDMLVLLLRTIVEKEIEGDIAELGVYQGHTAKLIHYYVPERRLHLFDTFEGFTDRCIDAEKERSYAAVKRSRFANTSLEEVKKYIYQKNNNVLYYKGYFPESIHGDLDDVRFAFVHLDADLYEPTFEGLQFFYPRMSSRGVIVVHDYNAWPGVRKAADHFFLDKPELLIPMPDKSGSVLIVKQ